MHDMEHEVLRDISVDQKVGPPTRKTSIFSDTKWKKGAPSPNPSGRPKGHKEYTEACRLESWEALRVLTKIMNDKDATNADRIAACSKIMDRAWGKPKQEIESNTGLSIVIVRPDELTSEEIIARYPQPFELTHENTDNEND